MKEKSSSSASAILPYLYSIINPCSIPYKLLYPLTSSCTCKTYSNGFLNVMWRLLIVFWSSDFSMYWLNCALSVYTHISVSSIGSYMQYNIFYFYYIDHNLTIVILLYFILLWIFQIINIDFYDYSLCYSSGLGYMYVCTSYTYICIHTYICTSAIDWLLKFNRNKKQSWSLYCAAWTLLNVKYRECATTCDRILHCRFRWVNRVMRQNNNILVFRSGPPIIQYVFYV